MSFKFLSLLLIKMRGDIYQQIEDSITEEFIDDDDNITREYEYIGICANLGDTHNEDVDMLVLVFIRIEDGVIYLINNSNIGYEKYKERGQNIDMLKNVFDNAEDMFNAGENFGNIYSLLLQYDKYNVFQAIDFEDTFEIDFDEEFFNNPEFEEIFENTKYVFNDDFIENINLVLGKTSNNKIKAHISFGITEEYESDIEEI